MTRWKVGLSNGENFTEEVFPFEATIGVLSPWLRLRKYCQDHKLKITSLCLIEGGRTFNLPSASTNPKFKAFFDRPKPIDFNFGRPIGVTQGSKPELYAMIEAIYESYTLQLWVDENNTKNCWVLVK